MLDYGNKQMCNLFFSSASLLELQIQHCPWHNVVKRQAVCILKEKVKELQLGS